MSTKPALLFIDIETSQNLLWGWGLGDQYVGYDQIAKESEVICICYQWEGNAKVNALIWDAKKYNLLKYDDDADKKILEEFSKIYSQADLAIGHNCKKFDIAVLQARIIKHKLPPLAPTLIDDTYLQSKNIRFTSHKLDYLSKYLEIGHKIGNEEGRKLWIKVQQGDKHALQKMVQYCKNDIVLLNKIYHRLQPYIKSNLNQAIFDGRPTICSNPLCKSENSLERRGFVLTTAGKYPRYQCKICGKWQSNRKNMISESGRYSR